MEHLFHLIVDGAQAHPHFALAIIGLVAFAESVAIVGTIVPAAVVMFAGGALIGQGVLGWGSTLLLAVVGAVGGDALSFELGRRYEQRVRQWQVFQRHLGAVRHAEDFVREHGALSIVLARFTGAVRAFVPLIAGFSHMARLRFYLTNIGSALLWAPVHLLPGVLFGSSLQLAEAVSGRLAMMVLLLVVLIALVVWLVTRGLRWVGPVLRRGRDIVVRWGQGRSGNLARLALDLLDPARPSSHALLFGAVVLLGAGWVFLGVLQDVIAGDPLVQADHAVNAFFEALRTEPVDKVMIIITEMGSAAALLPVIAVTALWLLLRGARRTLLYWLGSVLVAELLVQVLKVSLGRQRPSELYAGIESFSFPSGHATMSMVVFGLLAFLLARGATAGWRTFVLAITGADVALVSLSRLYLGAHWLSDVLAGTSLGMLWVTFCAMVYVRRHVDEPIHARQLAALVAATVVVATSVWHRDHGMSDTAFYAPQTKALRVLDGPVFAAGGWPGVPQQRRELGGGGEERFALQWACQRSGVEQAMTAAGWRSAPPWSLRSALGEFANQTSHWNTPVLPRFDRGQPNALSYVRATGDQQRHVLRMWRSTVALNSGRDEQPIWYGTVYDERRRVAGVLKGWERLAAVESRPAEVASSLGLGAAVQVEPSDSVLMIVCR